MKQLAIKGHTTRGKEVIEILEMLGGKNPYGAMGNSENLLYFIHTDIIQFLNNDNLNLSNFIIFTLEEFLEKFPYKVGDKVNSKYLKNHRIEKMGWKDTYNRVTYKLQGVGWFSADELEPYKEETMEEKDTIDHTTEINLNHPCFGKCNEIELIIPVGWEFKRRGNKMFGVRKQYPKTYEECCKVLGCEPNRQNVTGYYAELIEDFQKLLICRDAYWKIAREQMKLDEPWNNTGKNIYIIGTSYDRKIIKDFFIEPSFKYTFSFPTMEMQNAFYENFKDLIEDCKELL